MTDTTTAADKVEQLPVKHREKTHRWNKDSERRLAATEFPDGNARTERDCLDCPIIKITVHSPDGRAWREWSDHRAKGVRFQCESTPPCAEQKE